MQPALSYVIRLRWSLFRIVVVRSSSSEGPSASSLAISARSSATSNINSPHGPVLPDPLLAGKVNSVFPDQGEYRDLLCTSHGSAISVQGSCRPQCPGSVPSASGRNSATIAKTLNSRRPTGSVGSWIAPPRLNLTFRLVSSSKMSRASAAIGRAGPALSPPRCHQTGSQPALTGVRVGRGW